MRGPSVFAVHMHEGGDALNFRNSTDSTGRTTLAASHFVVGAESILYAYPNSSSSSSEKLDVPLCNVEKNLAFRILLTHSSIAVKGYAISGNR